MEKNSPLVFASGVAIGVCSLALLHYFSKQKKIETLTAHDHSLETSPIDLPTVDPITLQIPSAIGVPHPATLLPEYLDCIYLDYNATTPVYPEVVEEMKKVLETRFGNPSSSHIFGKPSKDIVHKSRKAVANLINADSSASIYFTSCGTESDNWAIDLGINHFYHFREQVHLASIDGVEFSDQEKPHIIVSAIEHPAILSYLKYLKEKENKIEFDILPVDSTGMVNPADLEDLLKDNTCLVSVMHSNNEVGTINPLGELSRIIRRFNAQRDLNSVSTPIGSRKYPSRSNSRPDLTSPSSPNTPNTPISTFLSNPSLTSLSNSSSSSLQLTSQRLQPYVPVQVLFHSEAAQSLGKVKVDVQGVGLDMLTLVGHKMGAPKGIAALYVHQTVKVVPRLHGGGQEGGMRSGTENVLLIAGLGLACQIASQEGARAGGGGGTGRGSNYTGSMNNEQVQELSLSYNNNNNNPSKPSSTLLIHLLTLKRELILGLKQRIEKKFPGTLRFNGPPRSNNPEEINTDLKLLKALHSTSSFLSLSSEATFSSTTSSRSSSSSDGEEVIDQLPNTVSVSFKGLRASELVHRLRESVACSAGSACHATTTHSTLSASSSSSSVVILSPVLEAMGVDPLWGAGTLRLSFGRHTSKEEILKAVERIGSVVESLLI